MSIIERVNVQIIREYARAPTTLTERFREKNIDPFLLAVYIKKFNAPCKSIVTYNAMYIIWQKI